MTTGELWPVVQGRRFCLQAAPCVLAVGHASRDSAHLEQGALALWSLKDPPRPLASFSAPAGVTSVAWSRRTPAHIAVGMRTGIIAIYDARQDQASSL